MLRVPFTTVLLCSESLWLFFMGITPLPWHPNWNRLWMCNASRFHGDKLHETFPKIRMCRKLSQSVAGLCIYFLSVARVTRDYIFSTWIYVIIYFLHVLRVAGNAILRNFFRKYHGKYILYIHQNANSFRNPRNDSDFFAQYLSLVNVAIAHHPLFLTSIMRCPLTLEIFLWTQIPASLMTKQR